MKARTCLAIVLLTAAGAAWAQTDSMPPAGDSSQESGPPRGQGGGRGLAGRGITGVVTAATESQFTIKTEAGQNYVVRFTGDTRFLEEGPRQRGSSEQQSPGERRNPPRSLKANEIKVGDTIAAVGDIDSSANAVGAVVVFKLDPERARQLREMRANYGKTWLMGKVTAMDELKITLLGAMDNVSHTVVVDEQTSFRKRRDPITLADIKIGDMIRVEGAIKDGIFAATSVNVTGMPHSRPSDSAQPPAGNGPGSDAPPQSDPQSSAPISSPR